MHLRLHCLPEILISQHTLNLIHQPPKTQYYHNRYQMVIMFLLGAAAAAAAVASVYAAVLHVVDGCHRLRPERLIPRSGKAGVNGFINNTATQVNLCVGAGGHVIGDWPVCVGVVSNKSCGLCTMLARRWRRASNGCLERCVGVACDSVRRRRLMPQQLVVVAAATTAVDQQRLGQQQRRAETTMC